MKPQHNTSGHPQISLTRGVVSYNHSIALEAVSSVSGPQHLQSKYYTQWEGDISDEENHRFEKSQGENEHVKTRMRMSLKFRRLCSEALTIVLLWRSGQFSNDIIVGCHRCPERTPIPIHRFFDLRMSTIPLLKYFSKNYSYFSRNSVKLRPADTVD